MADNKLNLVVQFLGIDKLSPALKTIIGLGKSSRQELNALYSEQRKLNKGIADYDAQIKKAAGDTKSLTEEQKKLKLQQEAVGAQIEKRKRVMAIDGTVAKVSAHGQSMVSSGMSTLMTGGAMAAPLISAAKSAGDVEAMTNRLRVLGLGDAAVKNLRDYADAMNVAGSSVQDNMRYLVEAQGVFRESGEHNLSEQIAGARLMAPMMAKLKTTSKALGQDFSEDQERYFLRFVEQAGGVNDPHRAAELTDGLFRALQSSGGNVDPSNYQGFLSRAGTAGMKLSARSMFADFEPLIAELHDSAGVGLQTAYARANGMVKNNAAAEEMLRLGIWDKSAVEMNKMGTGIKRFVGGKNPLGGDMANLLATSPVDFYIKMRERYDKMGVKDVQRENLMLFGRTGGQLFNLIDKQLPTIMRSREAYQRTQGLNQAYDNTKNSFFGQTGQMTAAWKNFTVAAGGKGGLLTGLTNGLRMATVALNALTGAANAHPTAMKWIGTAVTSLLGLKLATAGAKVAFGGLLGPVVKIWGWWNKLKVLGGFAGIFQAAGPAITILTGPVGWIVGAIALIGAGAYLIYRNWGGISAFFKRHWTSIRNFMLGAFVVLFPVLAALIVYIHRHWGAISAFFKRVGKRIYNNVIVPFEEATQYLKNLLGPWVQWGADLVWGVIKGIGSMTASVIMAVVNLAKKIGGAFAEELGINSPSRVFMAFGGGIAKGLGMGVDRNRRHPVAAVRKMGVAMAGALAVSTPAMAVKLAVPAQSTTRFKRLPALQSAPGFARPTPAHTRASGGGDATASITIHIYQKPGENAEALAERVIRRIKQAQRNRERRSYEDDF